MYMLEVLITVFKRFNDDFSSLPLLVRFIIPASTRDFYVLGQKTFPDTLITHFRTMFSPQFVL
jgi:hypothetical protein